MYQLAKYATATTIYFSMVKRGVVDLAQSADWTPATGDTKISINGGTLANTTNNPAIVAGTNGVLWSLALTTGELTGADIRIQIVDSATKAVEDQSLTVYTYGNASAKIVADYSTAALGALMPTTAGRTLDVSTGGEAGMDWANIGSPTTTVNLSGTSTKAVEPTVAGRTLDVASTGEAGLDFNNVNLPVGPVPVVGIIENGTLQSATSTTAVLRSATNFADNLINGAVIVITGGTGAGQTRLIVASVNSSDTVTVDPAWTTTPDNTSTYIVAAAPPAPTSSSYLQTVLLSVGTGTGQVNLSSGNVPATVAGAVGSVTGNVGGNVVGSVGSVTGAVGSVTGNVGGNVVGTVAGVTPATTAGILTTALTESYAADGAAGTLSQILFGLQAFLQERAVSGTTLTVKKLDGSTTAMTFTLNDGTSPTSLTRAT